MLLKRLELQGFKSFADKTTLDLGHRVTAIVGPNGSGKSNVTDSIRWLLGERDARNLRGGKGEDLIFAGTKDKPRSGMAQATLHFDNSSGALPLEYKDIAISRKVTRDGFSSFAINKSEVRLKDVIEFFAKAKLGARGLTIISQGESDIFIKASPQERREMIEEILGLKEYQLKKAESLRRLKNTNVNLEKARALVEELKPHLRLLRRQVSRYEGREETEKELKDLEDSYFGSRLSELEGDLKKCLEEEAGVATSLKSANLKFEQLRRDLLKTKEGEPRSASGLETLRKQESDLQGQRADLQIELGKLEMRLEMAKDRGGFDPQKAKTTLAEIKKLATGAVSGENPFQMKEVLQKIVELIDKNEKTAGIKDSGDVERNKQTLLSKLGEIDGRIAKIKDQEKSLRENLEGFNKSLSTSYELLENQQKQVSSLEAQRSNLLISKERLGTKLEGLLEELSQVGRQRDTLRVSKAKIPENEARNRMVKLRGQLASIGEIDESVVKEARETEDRYEFLAGQIDDLDKAVADLSSLVDELDKKIHDDFNLAMQSINDEFTKLIKIVFGGGRGSLKLERVRKAKTEEENEEVLADEEVKAPGVEVDVVLPKKRIKGLDVLSGGERALVSIAALFSLISVSSPPFLFLDEVDAALDERNARRFGEILKEFSKNTQFVIVTHNRATMEAADVLYGVTMTGDGTSKLVSLKLTE
ncbi:MAG: AAA family ATPase [bacterium]|nr:AAA family ATPase [bacterium]MDZ4231493.1 AAA family ATPase [Patescibacteria group bacterium]